MNINNLIDDYLQWLKSEISFEKIGEYYEITTPYLNNANDYMQIYVCQKDDEILFSDDGAIINSLKSAGFEFTKNRKEYLENLLFQYGIKLDGDALVTKSDIKLFPQKKHIFLQAMLKVDDMFAISKQKVSSYFLDDVQNFFKKNEIYYTENVQFTGVSGFTHNYDFLLQRSKNKPERLCQTVNNPQKAQMESIIFKWNDTKQARNNDSQLIVLLNDKNKIAKGVIDGFKNYQANVIRWSEINKNIDLLTSA